MNTNGAKVWWTCLLPVSAVAVMACVFGQCFSAEQGEAPKNRVPESMITNRANSQTPSGVPARTNIISPEMAFKRGIQSLGGKVDLSNTNGIISFHRSRYGYWHMQFMKYPGLPWNGKWVRIKDDGSVETGTAL